MDTAFCTSLRFVRRREEYSSLNTYVFRATELVPFRAGQYAHLRLLSLPTGQRRVREFSFASAPRDEEIWFGVDGRSGSTYQKALQSLKPGDSAELFKIRGQMTWPPLSDVTVMIAGGVGVTPFRGMLRDRQQRRMRVRTLLVQVSRAEFLYADELRHLSDEHIAIGPHDLPRVVTDVVRHNRAARFYVAGSETFVAWTFGLLRDAGISDVAIEADNFKGLAADAL